MPVIARGETPDISVVIPSYRSGRYLARCLTALLRQETESRFEVVLVDSSPGVDEARIAGQFPLFEFLRRDARASAAQARNLGAQAARGRLIAFLDADCEADPGWIEAISRGHRGHSAVIGGAVALANGHSFPGAILFAIEFSEFTPATTGYGIRDKWLPSCNLSIDRGLFLASGGFPEELEASEDILFSRRLIAGSHSLRFEPTMIVRHHNDQSWPDMLQHLRTLGRWSALVRAYPEVPGRILLRFHALIPLLVPYRSLMTLWRIATRRCPVRLKFQVALGFPLLVYALLIWCAAFHRGALEVRGR